MLLGYACTCAMHISLVHAYLQQACCPQAFLPACTHAGMHAGHAGGRACARACVYVCVYNMEIIRVMIFMLYPQTGSWYCVELGPIACGILQHMAAWPVADSQLCIWPIALGSVAYRLRCACPCGACPHGACPCFSWPMAHGPWPMAYCPWPMAYGPLLMATALWLMAHGSMVHGPQCYVPLRHGP